MIFILKSTTFFQTITITLYLQNVNNGNNTGNKHKVESEQK